MARCSSCKHRRKYCGGRSHRGKCAECARLNLTCIFLEQSNGARAHRQSNSQGRRPRTHSSNSPGLSLDRRPAQTAAWEKPQIAPAAVGIPQSAGATGPACAPPHPLLQTYAELNMQPIPVTAVAMEPLLRGQGSQDYLHQPDGMSESNATWNNLARSNLAGQGSEWFESMDVAAGVHGSLLGSVGHRQGQGHNHDFPPIAPSPAASLGPATPWNMPDPASPGNAFGAGRTATLQQEQFGRQRHPLVDPPTTDDPSVDLTRFQRHIIFALPGVFRLVFELEGNVQGGEDLRDLLNHESSGS
ncbi:uncharacterized protein EI90DRAFT_3043716 [Cantharellus anzutake]|uniref:uncharacterized protein n=1 Tax=Cantharellus anzutake TaxID=1750568 RepID=UPI001904AA38|nr:uncharacterized protein EI90DRAFT_3043716 [Cantharellus anzutake]KAF8336812.1 hypothetical protein EI90DRAFT_3043716 [Cantharellus anzutake]